MWEKLVSLSHSALSSVGEEVTDILGEETQRIITELKDTLLFLQRHNVGVGLAAAQLGYAKKIFVICITEERAARENCDPFPMTVFINSQVEYLEKEDTVVGPEGCFSLPGIRVQDVSRYSKIKITYFDEEGCSQERILSHFPARVAQHEYDHEQGMECVQQSSVDLAELKEWSENFGVTEPPSGIEIVKNPNQLCDFSALTRWLEKKLESDSHQESCSFRP